MKTSLKQILEEKEELELKAQRQRFFFILTALALLFLCLLIALQPEKEPLEKGVTPLSINPVYAFSYALLYLLPNSVLSPSNFTLSAPANKVFPFIAHLLAPVLLSPLLGTFSFYLVAASLMLLVKKGEMRLTLIRQEKLATVALPLYAAPHYQKALSFLPPVFLLLLTALLQFLTQANLSTIQGIVTLSAALNCTLLFSFSLIHCFDRRLSQNGFLFALIERVLHLSPSCLAP